MKKNTFEIGLDLQSNWSDIYQATDETDKYPTASPERAVNMVSVGITDCFRIFVLDGHCHGKSG